MKNVKSTLKSLAPTLSISLLRVLVVITLYQMFGRELTRVRKLSNDRDIAQYHKEPQPTSILVEDPNCLTTALWLWIEISALNHTPG